jgi:general secretion pathway protein E/type IV pilus assembly protein PilB
MAFRAAMTGHRVFSTLHTNSALGAVPRLHDIGISADILAGNIIGIIAQRLVRVLCPHCKQAQVPEADERRLLGIETDDAAVYRSVGCTRCGHTGYRGRMALMELLVIDDELDAMIARRAHLDEMQSAAIAKGFITLAEDAVRRVREGHTSLAEVRRVVDLSRIV